MNIFSENFTRNFSKNLWKTAHKELKSAFAFEWKTEYFFIGFYIFLAIFTFSFFFFDPANGNFLTAAITGAATTTPVFDGEGLAGGAKIVEENIDGQLGIIEEGSFLDAFVYILKWILILAGIVAFISFLWAGFLYISSFGEEEGPEKAKKIMIYSAIGILIIIFSWVIVNFLTTLEF